MLADCFEALLGAIFLDGGFQSVQHSFDHMMQSYLELEGEQFIHFDNLLEFDAKSILQERTMREFKALPEYVYEQLEDGQFKISIYINTIFLKSIVHISKKKGAKLLAKQVLQENLLEGVRNAQH
jgi:ribonuclease-3